MLPPLLLVALAWLASASGLDDRLAGAFFDSVSQGFPARESLALELLGHRLAKSAVLAAWLLLLATAAVSPRLPRLAPHRRLLWTTVAAMAVGPVLVVALKAVTAHPCPWDLRRYGGLAEATGDWFVGPSHAGRCFPSGHTAGGFSLVAFYFAARAADRPALARALLWLAVAMGTAFGAVRMVQGAHFLSHNLWAAAIDWIGAAIVFRIAGTQARTRCGLGASATGAPMATGLDKVQPPGWVRLAAASGYAAAGLRATWRREAAFRQEAIAALLLAPVALLAPVSPLERAALLGALLLVLVVELLNSAIEAVVDLVSPQRHPLAGVAKDAGAAAVMLTLAIAVLTWASVLWPWAVPA